MTIQDIVQLSFIYIEQLGPAILCIAVAAVADDVVWLVRKAVNPNVREY